jgi:hypothetical protein
MKKICNPSLVFTDYFVLSYFLAKIWFSKIKLTVEGS